MQRSMTCEEAYKEIYEYLDRELSEAELSIVRKHLEDCPPCAHHFQFEGTVVRYIREQGARETCPAAVAKAILTGFRARISQRLSS
jgi:mycothiol system anti-sigma-R factor